MIKLRITLESKQDVIRELVLDSELNLEQLHQEIIKHFNLNEFEMASFYIADTNLDLGQEIPLFDTSEKGNEVITMNQMIISSVLHSPESQLIYVYDFLNMWRFHIQFVEENEGLESGCDLTVGEMPKEAPEIKFKEEKGKKEFDPYGDAFEDFDEFNDYEY
jgi:hypothetical protein